MSAALRAQASERSAFFSAAAATCIDAAQAQRERGDEAAADRLLMLAGVHKRHAARLATLAGSTT